MSTNYKNREKETIQKRKIRAATTIGLWGGIFWGFVGWLVYILNLSSIGPHLVSHFFLGRGMTWVWLEVIIGILIITVFSIAVSILYVYVLVKIKSPYVGIGYGLVLWAIVFYLINPILHVTPSIKGLGQNTTITTICLYILFGLFIGYSLVVEFNRIQDEGSNPST